MSELLNDLKNLAAEFDYDNHLFPACDMLLNVIRKHEDDIARAIAFQEAVEDACVINFINFNNDPREVLGGLIGIECSMALDPTISDEAQDLITKGRNDCVDYHRKNKSKMGMDPRPQQSFDNYAAGYRN